MERIGEAVLDHGVEELHVAHLLPVAQMRDVGGEGHGFLPARHDDGGVAIGDLLHAQRHSAQARAAELVEAPGGLFLRNSGLHGGLTGRVLALAGGEDLAEDHLVHLAGIDARALKGGLDGHGAQIMGGHGAEDAAEGSHRRARGAYNHDIGCHLETPLATDLEPFRPGKTCVLTGGLLFAASPSGYSPALARSSAVGRS